MHKGWNAKEVPVQGGERWQSRAVSHMPANAETHGERVVVSPSTVRSLGLCSLGGMSLSTFLWAPSGDPSFSFILHNHILSQHWELCPAWEKQTSENHFLLVKGWDSRPGYFKSQVGESVLLL